MFIAVAVSAAAAVGVNLLYFKAKHDKLLFPIISAVIFSVVISVMIFEKSDIITYMKYFVVLSFLHICSTNDIIRHQSDNIFPIMIILIGLIMPQSLFYNLISLAVIAVIFIIIIISSETTIGGGDIKMICALTFFFGIGITASALIIACITGIIYAIAAKTIAKLPDFNKHFAFLPFVEVGYVTVLLIKLY